MSLNADLCCLHSHNLHLHLIVIGVDKEQNLGRIFLYSTPTSFLTATTLINTIGAGITAAADTRLALRLILDKGFTLLSFQLPDLCRPGIVIYCHYLPVSGLGNLRACCLPWMW